MKERYENNVLKKKRAISLVLSLMLVLSSQAFAGSISKSEYNTGVKENEIYKELTKNDGVTTFYYQDFNKDDVIVITSSEHAGTKGYYNDGENLFEIDVYDLDVKLDDNLTELYQFEELISNITDNKSDVKLIPIEVYLDRILDVEINNISPLGISSAKQYLIGLTGSAYSDKLITSPTTQGKYAQIFESKGHSVYEINRFMLLVDDVAAVVFAKFALSPQIALGLGIAVVIKNGIEYIKHPYTILKYNATMHLYRDVDVNERTCHQVQRRSVYSLWENDGKFTNEFEFGDEDPYFGNTRILMEIGVNNYS